MMHVGSTVWPLSGGGRVAAPPPRFYRVSYIEVGGRVVERDRGRGEKEGEMEKEKKEGVGVPCCLPGKYIPTVRATYSLME